MDKQSKAKRTKKPCLYPVCLHLSRARGLCMNHYLMAGRLVSAKLTSWEHLERTGKALPSKRIAPFKSPAGKWFLNKHEKRKEA